LRDFTTHNHKTVFFNNENPVIFDIKYENTGNVHTNPYGVLTITNIYGATVGEIEILPYYALPHSLRINEVRWEHHIPLFGRYTATLTLHRGYGNKQDITAVTLWFIPWKWILIIFTIIALLVMLVRWFTTTFELKKK